MPLRTTTIPTASLGPNGLDRTHQFSFGGTMDIPWCLRFGAVGHVYSPLPQNMILPGGGAGGIFISESPVMAQAMAADLSHRRPRPRHQARRLWTQRKDRRSGRLHHQLQRNLAGNPTPAGQALVNNGLLTLAQLQALGGIFQRLPRLRPGQAAGLAEDLRSQIQLSPKVRRA